MSLPLDFKRLEKKSDPELHASVITLTRDHGSRRVRYKVVETRPQQIHSIESVEYLTTQLDLHPFSEPDLLV
jgi:hypothetical protein